VLNDIGKSLSTASAVFRAQFLGWPNGQRITMNTGAEQGWNEMARASLLTIVIHFRRIITKQTINARTATGIMTPRPICSEPENSARKAMDLQFFISSPWLTSHTRTGASGESAGGSPFTVTYCGPWSLSTAHRRPRLGAALPRKDFDHALPDGLPAKCLHDGHALTDASPALQRWPLRCRWDRL